MITMRVIGTEITTDMGMESNTGAMAHTTTVTGNLTCHLASENTVINGGIYTKDNGTMGRNTAKAVT